MDDAPTYVKIVKTEPRTYYVVWGSLGEVEMGPEEMASPTKARAAVLARTDRFPEWEPPGQNAFEAAESYRAHMRVLLSDPERHSVVEVEEESTREALVLNLIEWCVRGTDTPVESTDVDYPEDADHPDPARRQGDRREELFERDARAWHDVKGRRYVIRSSALSTELVGRGVKDLRYRNLGVSKMNEIIRTKLQGQIKTVRFGERTARCTVIPETAFKPGAEATPLESL
jgi:hypothetical protein